MAVKVNRSVFYGLQVTSMSILEPRIEWYPVDASSPTLRIGDPVKQVAGGGAYRMTPADTVVLGICAGAQGDVLPTSIAHINNPQGSDAGGRPLVPIYVADHNTQFRGECVAPPTAALRAQLHDLRYAINDADVNAPTIANVGTAGSTTYGYRVSAVTPNGETLATANVNTTTGNATLSATNYNTVTIPPVSNTPGRPAFFYIYRNGFYVGSVPASAALNVVFNDIGAAATSQVPATLNQTGWVVDTLNNAVGMVQVRDLDTTPVTPFVATALNGAVLFNLNPLKSQYMGVAGS